MRSVFASLVLCISGCSLITDVDALQPAVMADAGSDAACSSDLTADPINCGRCGHDCFGGKCTAGTCTPVAIALGEAFADNLAEDATSLYWSRVENNKVAQRQLRTIAKSGGVATSLTTGQLIDVLVLGGPAIYVVREDNLGQTLYMEPKLGGAPEQLVVTDTTLAGLAADDTAAYVLRPNPNGVSFVGYRIVHGGSPAPWGPATLDIASGRVDDSNYFGDNGTTVFRLPKTGMGATTNVVSVTTQMLAAIAISDDELVYARSDVNTIRATSKLGANGKGDRLVAGAVRLVGQSFDDRTFVARGHWLAWAESASLYACDLTMCEATRTRLVDHGLITSIAIAEGRVYFTDSQSAGVYAVALP